MEYLNRFNHAYWKKFSLIRYFFLNNKVNKLFSQKNIEQTPQDILFIDCMLALLNLSHLKEYDNMKPFLYPPQDFQKFLDIFLEGKPEDITYKTQIVIFNCSYLLFKLLLRYIIF